MNLNIIFNMIAKKRSEIFLKTLKDSNLIRMLWKNFLNQLIMKIKVKTISLLIYFQD